MNPKTDILGKHAIVKGAQGDTIAEGKIVSYCDAPTVGIETAKGERMHWRFDLCEIVGENEPRKPSRELDKLVAEVLGWTQVSSNDVAWYGRPPIGHPQHQFMTIDLPCYSTHWLDALQAWEWLVWNNPWTRQRTDVLIVLGWRGGPCVMVVSDAINFPILPWSHQHFPNFYILGESYEHAVCLAILEAVKVTKEQ